MAIFPRQSWFCYCSVFASTEQTDRATNKRDRIAGQLNSLLLFTVNDWLHSKMTIFKNYYISGPLKTRKSILEMAWVKNAIKKCLNVRQKLGTRSLSHTLSFSHSLTLSLSHSLTLNMLNNFCFHVYAQKSLSHFHTLTLSHSITLDMLNKFCFHLYAQKSLIMAENCNAFFLTTSSSCEFGVHGAGSQLKITSWAHGPMFHKI